MSSFSNLLRHGLFGLLISCATISTLTADAWAQYSHDTYSPALGIGIGGNFPFNEENLKMDLDGGFYVNIPLIQSFHLTPSAEIYTLRLADAASQASSIKELPATDLSLAFKFIVPLYRLDFYFGAPLGISHLYIPKESSSEIRFHAGLLGGLAFNLISNIDVFAQCTYKIIFTGDILEENAAPEIGNISSMRVNAGFLFNFVR